MSLIHQKGTTIFLNKLFAFNLNKYRLKILTITKMYINIMLKLECHQI